ncbi:MAG: hypothetical protein A3J24_08190 [Deltaproteobacteria bacterium RIFCSPLOWO2_02_FULL_53_8]|nr:MAG: hypothetical protein A3J24_08190 [Deltaproteobacteria bacterium RIFCSPLOWO2_02_FULL_53_8]
MSVTALIPVQYRLLAIGLAVATLMTLSAAGAWQWQANAYGKQIADMRTAQAEAHATVQAQARATEQRRQLAIEGIREDAKDKIDQAAADAAAADAHALGLQQQVDKLARRPASCPGAATGSAAADPAKLLLAELFRRADARAGELAAYADRARIAGRTCGWSFDAVKGG